MVLLKVFQMVDRWAPQRVDLLVGMTDLRWGLQMETSTAAQKGCKKDSWMVVQSVGHSVAQWVQREVFQMAPLLVGL